MELPSAPTDLYLSWASFLLGAERNIRSSERVLRQAQQAGYILVPFVHTLRSVLIAPMVSEAARAVVRREARVSPVLHAAGEELLHVADYVERWGIWLVEDGILSRIGMRLPEPGVAALRRSVITSIRQRTHESA